MSGRAGTRHKWQRAVLSGTDLADAVKVTLLAYALFMTDAGYVSVPRETVAGLIGKHPRKVGEHITVGVRAGYLQKIGGGYRGVTAQYVAVTPGRKVAA